jgi:hypothetical protein
VTDSSSGASAPDRGASLAIDTSVAHPARVYDYWLGGQNNYPADRAAGAAAAEANPNILIGVRANRSFLRRAVRYLAAGPGIRQFLDIGAGLPSANGTREVAQAVAPQARIVYAPRKGRPPSSTPTRVIRRRSCGRRPGPSTSASRSP